MLMKYLNQLDYLEIQKIKKLKSNLRKHVTINKQNEGTAKNVSSSPLLYKLQYADHRDLNLLLVYEECIINTLLLTLEYKSSAFFIFINCFIYWLFIY